MMSLSLKEKQQLRSVIEVIIQNPEYAKKLFNNINNIRQSDSFGTLTAIEPLIRFVCDYDFNTTPTDRSNYFQKIQEISFDDNDVRKLITSSINDNKLRKKNWR